MMPCDVLLVIDLSRRELIGCLLVRHFLERLGLKARLCSRFNLAQAYNETRPAAVVVPNAFLHLIDEISPQAYVFLLPSESGSGQRESIQVNFAGTVSFHCRTAAVDKVFCWGPKMAQWLLEDGIYPQEKLIVTGSPMTDDLLIRKKPILAEGKGAIGITTSFRMLISSQGNKLNIFDWCYSSERSGNGTYYDPPQHVESWIFYEAAFARLLVDIVEELAVRRDFLIRIRPHPFEVEEQYRFFDKFGKGRVIIEKKGPMSEWLETVSVVLTFLSTTAVDAAIQQVPVISLRKLINQEAIERIPQRLNYDFENFLWQAEDFQTLSELCSEALAGRLPVSPRQKDLDAFIYDHFFIPREKPASLLVAEEINRVVKNGRKQKPFSPIGGPQPVPFYRKMMRRIYPNIDLVWFYLYGRAQGNLDIGFTYLPWRIKVNNEARQSVARILEQLKLNL